MGRKLTKIRVFNEKEYKRGEEYFKTEEEVDYEVEVLRDSGYRAIKAKNKQGYFMWIGGEREDDY